MPVSDLLSAEGWATWPWQDFSWTYSIWHPNNCWTCYESTARKGRKPPQEEWVTSYPSKSNSSKLSIDFVSDHYFLECILVSQQFRPPSHTVFWYPSLWWLRAQWCALVANTKNSSQRVRPRLWSYCWSTVCWFILSWNLKVLTFTISEWIFYLNGYTQSIKIAALSIFGILTSSHRELYLQATMSWMTTQLISCCWSAYKARLHSACTSVWRYRLRTWSQRAKKNYCGSHYSWK